MDPDGSNAKKLTEHGMDPSWSPDGKQIAFASHRDGIFQIYAMNSDGSNVRRLTKNNAEDSNPAWAPDGGSIVYISATGDDRRGLFLIGADGSDPHGLAHSKHEDFCFPSWAPDGGTIVFSALNRLGPQGIVAGEEKPRCEPVERRISDVCHGRRGEAQAVKRCEGGGHAPQIQTIIKGKRDHTRDQMQEANVLGAVHVRMVARDTECTESPMWCCERNTNN